ncbi:flagellar hook-length control protein FliK [Lichenicola sp.]|uniref:flagellar hook-length control protein FliK n=1 Tax=Lichenicola sp. TaxID=2804529 RepID=UPI003B000458
MAPKPDARVPSAASLSGPAAPADRIADTAPLAAIGVPLAATPVVDAMPPEAAEPTVAKAGTHAPVPTSGRVQSFRAPVATDTGSWPDLDSTLVSAAPPAGSAAPPGPTADRPSPATIGVPVLGISSVGTILQAATGSPTPKAAIGIPAPARGGSGSFQATALAAAGAGADQAIPPPVTIATDQGDVADFHAIPANPPGISAASVATPTPEPAQTRPRHTDNQAATSDDAGAAGTVIVTGAPTVPSAGGPQPVVVTAPETSGAGPAGTGLTSRASTSGNPASIVPPPATGPASSPPGSMITALGSPAPVDPGAAPEQVAASLLVLAAKPDGSSQLALTLHPKELGTVHIQLDRSADGVTRINVTASNPATLRSLMSDQAHLHAALDAAAVPSANRHLSFELGAPSAVVAVRVHSAIPAAADRAHDALSGQRPESQAAQDMSGFRGSDQPGGGGSSNERASTFARARPGAPGDADDDTSTSLQPSFLSNSARMARSSRVNITA